MRKFFNSIKFKMSILLLLNIAIAVVAFYFGFLYVYFAGTILLSFLSIFVLANMRERDSYKIIVFLLMLMLPIVAIGYARISKEAKGGKRIKKEWSEILYRNRKTVFQNNETMEILKNENNSVYKTCNYIVESVRMSCHKSVGIKYYSFGDSYFKDLKESCEKAKSYILIECYKIVKGRTWTELFDTLRIKARDGVTVKLMYDENVCLNSFTIQEFEKMRNHGIETIPFNSHKARNGNFANCRNYKRISVIDGKIGYFGGFNITDEYVNDVERSNATKDCAIQLQGEAVKNLIIMFFEDYQFVTKKVINLQDYFTEPVNVKSKDWALPYSTNPVSLEHTNKNILISMINNAKSNITITTSYIALDDGLKNALIVSAKSGVKVRLIFAGDSTKSRTKTLARSYFYELIREGIEVYEFKGSKMTTKLMMVDNNTALITTSNLDTLNTYKHFNAGVYIYGDSVVLIYNDLREIIASSQIVTVKDLQKRKLTEKISATFSKFVALFR